MKRQRNFSYKEDDDVDELANENKALREEVLRLRAVIAEMERGFVDVSERAENIERRLLDLERRSNEMDAELEKLKNQINEDSDGDDSENDEDDADAGADSSAKTQ